MLPKYLLPLFIGLFALGCSNDSSDDLSFGNPTSGAQSGQSGSTGTINVGASGSTTGSSSGTSGAISSDTLEQLRKSACAGWSAEPESLPSILEFVVDTSGSMDDAVPSTAPKSKWDVTNESLVTSLGELPDSVAVGMLFYPNMDTSEMQCVNTKALIPIAQLGPQNSAQRTTIDSAIRAIEPKSYTPTYDAYDVALNQGLVPSKLPGKRFMVLITDGAPTLSQGCKLATSSSGGSRTRNGGMPMGGKATPVDPAPIVAEIQAAHDQLGIQTFVIGSPGSEESINGTDARVAWLSAAARAGGTARAGCSDTGPNFCHIDLTQSSDFAAALQSSLDQIAGAVVQCVYEVPAPPANQSIDLSAINVVYTDGAGSQTLIGRSSAPDCTDGWQLVGNQVQLCSNTCNQVKSDPGAAIELMFGCATVPLVK
jgi:hypothetical protein